MFKRITVLTGLAALIGCTEYEPGSISQPQFDEVTGAVGATVMTRNVYLGADLNPVIGAPAPQLVPLRAAQAWATIQASDFPARAGRLAAEIAQARPHLVGLQEVSLYQVQSPGDAAFGGAVPATAVAIDFLQILLDSLAARGLDYRVVASVTNTSAELPVYTGRAPVPFDDVRWTDQDVILARGDVAASNAQGAPYAARLNISVGGPGGAPVSLLRGWTSVDAVVNGRAIRFANTHLEIQSFVPLQTAQAQELIAILATSPLPVVAVGDFNSAADGTQTPAYSLMIAAGYADMWQSGSPGYTCCHDPLLRNEEPTLTQRIDLIFARGFEGRVIGASRVVGDAVEDRLTSGLWPSDHAGVVSMLRLPRGSAN